jgi:hypothetical protein
MDDSVRWKNLSAKAIARQLTEKRVDPTGLGTIRCLLVKYGYRRRQIVKKPMN